MPPPTRRPTFQPICRPTTRDDGRRGACDGSSARRRTPGPAFRLPAGGPVAVNVTDDGSRARLLVLSTASRLYEAVDEAPGDDIPASAAHIHPAGASCPRRRRSCATLAHSPSPSPSTPAPAPAPARDPRNLVTHAQRGRAGQLDIPDDLAEVITQDAAVAHPGHAAALVLVGEADPAVQPRVAPQLPVEAQHADQHQTQVAAIEEVAELLQACLAVH